MSKPLRFSGKTVFFCEVFMKELSIFVDESGDWGLLLSTFLLFCGGVRSKLRKYTNWYVRRISQCLIYTDKLRGNCCKYANWYVISLHLTKASQVIG